MVLQLKSMFFKGQLYVCIYIHIFFFFTFWVLYHVVVFPVPKLIKFNNFSLNAWMEYEG